ncbi:MAG: group II intron reverse transcriptase/maturase [Phycisphaerales bacterium JB038]
MRDRKVRFTTLWHHVYDVRRLREAYRGLTPETSAGVDGVTCSQYGQDLEQRLEELSARLARGACRARPVRRVFIPKPDGQQRALGVPTVEDRIVQRSAAQVIEAVFEADFLGFSYGFRPGRGAHDALNALAVGIEREVSWVLDADIRGFFDAIDHEWMMRFVEHRIADQRILRQLRKWLKAGVLVDGKVEAAERGTPQGGSISPLLANIYLHFVFDLWAHDWRQRNARGRVVLVRYADDFVVGFQHRSDALRFLEELRARMQRFHLELHPEKTRLIEFGRFARKIRKRRGQPPPESFDFLGFTHVCATTRKGRFRLARRTIKKRQRAKVAAIKAMLRRRMHDPPRQVGLWLERLLLGYYRYFAVPTNSKSLDQFRYQILRHWRRVLFRRGQKSKVPWRRFGPLTDRYLPRPRILHPWPSIELLVTTRGRSPVR